MNSDYRRRLRDQGASLAALTIAAATVLATVVLRILEYPFVGAVFATGMLSAAVAAATTIYHALRKD